VQWITKPTVLSGKLSNVGPADSITLCKAFLFSKKFYFKGITWGSNLWAQRCLTGQIGRSASLSIALWRVHGQRRSISSKKCGEDIVAKSKKIFRVCFKFWRLKKRLVPRCFLTIPALKREGCRGNFQKMQGVNIWTPAQLFCLILMKQTIISSCP
jgi:hypothetical protein